jgi:hypothetical protein
MPSTSKKRSGVKLGEIIVEKRTITSSALIDSLCVQLGILKI